MSEINSQINIQMIESIKEQSGTKTSLEKLNLILQEMHKNMMKESNSNFIKTSNIEDKNKTEEENPNQNEDSNFIEEIKGNNEENDEQDKEGTTGDNVGDNNDKISGDNLIKIRNSADYRSSNDINVINKRSSDFNINNNINYINNINNKLINNIISNDEKKEEEEKEKIKNEEKIEKKEEGSKKEKEGGSVEEEKEEKKEEKEDVKKEEKEKEKGEKEEKKEEGKKKEEKKELENERKEEESGNKISIRSEEPNEIKEENKINEKVIEKEKKDEYSYKEFTEMTLSTIGQNNINSFNMTQGSELYLSTIIDNIGGKESEKDLEDLTDSVKIDPNEEIHLGLTNYQVSNDEGNPSMLTNPLNKAIIRTHDFTKSKDMISNIESDFLQREEQEKTEKNNNLMKKPSKNKSLDKKSAIELFRQEPKKDENEIIKENKEQIKNEINNMYETELNLVKINNKEKFSYITKYNDPDKDKLGYEPDFFLCSKNSINYLNRRNNFLNHKYFSYILSKNDKVSNNNIKEKDKKKKAKDKLKEENDINDNYVYSEDEVKKHKKNYKEKNEPSSIKFNLRTSYNNNQTLKRYKIYEVEDMISFFYYFKLYSPEEKFKNNLDQASENEILKNFTTYRKVLNDGNSFKRAFVYSLLENFILKNQIKKFEYIMYDINNLLKKKYSEMKQIIDVLIDIKENSSIEYLANSFNNPNLNFDEILINYIEINIKKVLGIENNKRKYIEMDFNIMRILVNIFDVNLEIYYIEEEETNNNNTILKLNQLKIYNDIYLRTKKNLKASTYSDNDYATTFRFLFFLNSFYIVYTDKSDIDSSMANNNNERQHYYIDNLPTYKCPNCKENTGLDIIPSCEAIFCHICLTKYLKEIIEKRVVLFVKSNFSCIEYYTRPIKIISDIVINFSLYKYITNNYIITDFEKILDKTCFKCFKIMNEKNKIKKLKCLCQVCDTCLEKMIKENLKDKVYLNKYEIHNLPRTKCLCGNDVDLQNLLKFAKTKPNEKDKKMAENRLLNILKKKCCLCHESNEKKLFDFKIMQGPTHFMCVDCYEKEIKKENKDTDDIEGNEKNSDDNIIDDKKNIIKRKLFCKICYEEHIWIEDNEIVDKKNLIQKIEVKFKCCKENCLIF